MIADVIPHQQKEDTAPHNGQSYFLLKNVQYPIISDFLLKKEEYITVHYNS